MKGEGGREGGDSHTAKQHTHIKWLHWGCKLYRGASDGTVIGVYSGRSDSIPSASLVVGHDRGPIGGSGVLHIGKQDSIQSFHLQGRGGSGRDR